MIMREPTAEGRRAEREMRAAVRQQIESMGVPADKAAEIVDLGFHGASKAIVALIDAVSVTDHPLVQLNALLIAGSIIDERLRMAREGAAKMAALEGLKMTAATVTTGGQPS